MGEGGGVGVNNFPQKSLMNFADLKNRHTNKQTTSKQKQNETPILSTAMYGTIS